MRAHRLLVLLIGIVIAALPVPPSIAQPVTDVCTVHDAAITEGSGLLVLDDGFALMNDGGSSVAIYHLDQNCAVTGTTTAAVDPYDPEDLVAGPDDTFWVADIGDNNANRPHIAVLIVPREPGVQQALVRRFSYPDGPHDAESAYADPQGRLVVIAKTLSGVSGVYRSAAPVDLGVTASSDPAPLELIGTITLRHTNSPGGPISPPLSNLLSTGAAICTDRVALRTYTDVYMWGYSDDPALAMVTTEPVVLALPIQQQGESVAWSADCGMLFVHGEGAGVPISAVPAPQLPAEVTPAAESSSAQPDHRDHTVWFLAGGVVVLAIVLIVLVRAQTRRSTDTTRPKTVA